MSSQPPLSPSNLATPALTVGRMFANTFAGIARASIPAFVIAQTIGGLLAVRAIRARYPDASPADAADVVLPHADADRPEGRLVTESAGR